NIIDLNKLEEYMLNRGFEKVNPLRNDYINKELGILIEDLHDENVFLVNDKYFFIDTVFYTRDKDGNNLLQLESTKPKAANPQVVKLAKDLLERTGVKYEEVKDIYVNGVKVGASGVANSIEGLVQVIEGKESEALPEEAMHIAVEIIEQKNPKLFNRLLSEINNFEIYKKVIEEYGNNPYYQTSDGKPDIRKLKKEAIAKQLVATIINKVEGNTE